MSNEIPSSSSSSSSASTEAKESGCQSGENSSLVQDGGQSLSSNENEMSERDEFKRGALKDSDLFNLTPEELAVARKIFGYQVILRKILDNISSHNLFKFRLVNKFWEEEATSVIMEDSNSSTQLLITRDWKQTKSCLVLRAKGGNAGDRPLSELNSCISSSRRFPCSNFKIHDSLKFETDDLTQFLWLHGKEIKTYEIWNESIFVHPDILVEKAPNIQKLILNGNWAREDDEWDEYYGTDEFGEEPLLFPESVILPHLKYLHVTEYSNSSHVAEIMRSAPNLQKIDGQLIKAVDDLVLVNKLDLVKTLHICPEFLKFPSFLKKWSDQKPKLCELHLWFEYYTQEPWTLNMEKPLSQLLDSSRESLKEISVCLHNTFFNPDVIWPKLENVETLSIWNMLMDVQPFPSSFISKVFPNITKFKVHTDGPPNADPDFLDVGQLSFLATDAPLLRLNVVEIEDGYPEWFNLLAKTAPNVQELTLIGYTSIFKSIRFISTLSKLKKLSFGSEHGVLYSADQFPQLDMAMTGLSEDMVRKLHEDPVYFEEMKGQEIPRVTPSILDCQALENLTLHSPYFGMGEDDKPLFTSVSQEFGFNLMSQVNWTH